MFEPCVVNSSRSGGLRLDCEDGCLHCLSQHRIVKAKEGEKKRKGSQELWDIILKGEDMEG